MVHPLHSGGRMLARFRMLFFAPVLVAVALMSTPEAAQCASSHHYSSHPRSTASRPYYGGGHHTTSHGGSYPGSVNTHHKNGHYSNPRSGNRYGIHQAHRR